MRALTKILCIFVFTVQLIAVNDLPALQPAGGNDESQKGEATENRRMTVAVELNGRPVQGVNVVARVESERNSYTTNADGVVGIRIPAIAPKLFTIYVSGNFTPATASWRNYDPNEPDPIPKEFTFDVRKGTRISGNVVDETGKPVEGATVDLSGGGAKSLANPRIRQAWHDRKLKTDGNGVWTFEHAPTSPTSIYANVTHPDFVEERFQIRRSDQAGFEALFKGTHKVALMKGITIRGTVTDEEGTPLHKIKVVLGEPFRGTGLWETYTDEAGKYEIKNVRREPFALTVAGKEFAPAIRKITELDDNKAIDFQLKKGRPIRFHVMNEKGDPIEGARIVYDTWLSHRTLLEFDEVLPQRTNADGELVWHNAPEETVRYDVLVTDRMSARNLALDPSDIPHKIVIYRPLEISGNVVSKGSKQPIPNFKIIQGSRSGGGEISWSRSNLKRAENGRYYLRITEPRSEHFLKIEAENYKPAISRSFLNSDGKLTINFELERGEGIVGTVLDPKGEPVKGAKLYYALPGRGPYVRNNAQIDTRDLITTVSEMAGQFYLPEQDTRFAIMVVADQGFAYVYDHEFKEAKGEITLSQWATVRGKCMIGDKPAAGAEIEMSFDDEERGGGRPHRYFDYDTKVKEDGSFELTRVPPGMSATIGRRILLVRSGNGFTTTRTHGRKIELESGRTVEVSIGGTGRTVTGRFILPEGDDRKIDEWNYGFTTLKRVDGPDDAAHPDDTGSYRFRIKSDGAFRVADLPAGEYKLEARIHAPGEEFAFDGPVIGKATKTFTIEKMEGGRSDEVFEIGIITLETSTIAPRD